MKIMLSFNTMARRLEIPEENDKSKTLEVIKTLAINEFDLQNKEINIQIFDPDFNEYCDISHQDEIKNLSKLRVIVAENLQSEKTNFADDDNLQSATIITPPSLRTKCWNSSYIKISINDFSTSVRSLLTSANENFYNSGKLYDPPPNVKKECKLVMLNILKDFTWYPSTEQYDDVCKSLISCLPCLKEPIGSGYSGWRLALRYKIEDERRKLRSIENEVKLNTGKRKPGDQSKFKIKKGKRGEINFAPNFGEGSEEEVCLQIKSMLQEDGLDSSSISSYMELTFPLRRKEINQEHPMTLQQIKETWPTVFMEEQIVHEVQRLTGVNLDSAMQDQLDKCLPGLKLLTGLEDDAMVLMKIPDLFKDKWRCIITTDELKDWINALKPLCVTQMTRSPKVQRLRELRCLQLNIIDAHRLPYKLVPNPFCIVSLNQVKVARTKVKTGPDPVWDEEFILDDVPPDVLTFTVTVYNKGKRSKDTEVAELTVELSSLQNGDENENWYPLSGMTPIGEWGSLRLRTRYLHDLIMPQEEYSPMQQLMLDPSLEAVRALADLCHLDRTPLATSLLRIFRHERKEADLLKALNDAEIEKEEETSTLFRAASLTTTLMDLYMKSVCTEFLHSALRSTIQKLLDCKQSCELNPNKMDSPEDACNNAEFLLQVLDEVTHSIFLSAEACPKTVRYICGCLQRCVVGKWPHERLVRTRVVSGFIFLRLLCPAILNPRQFNLISEPPAPMASRSLIMVAKCLQNLANLVEFGGKEPYMEVVNPFILKNKERMVVFLDQLSNLVEKPESEGERVKGDPARDLGTLHHICVSHLKELQALSKTQTSLKKLVTVTEMLSKHKQKYLEMIR